MDDVRARVQLAVADWNPGSAVPNVPPRMLRAFHDAQRLDDLVVLPADKGGATILLKKSDYSAAVMDIIKNGKYTEVHGSPMDVLHTLDAEVRAVTASLPCPERLRTPGPTMPYIYALPKVHKLADIHNPGGVENLKWRPVVSMFQTPTYRLQQYLANVLKVIEPRHCVLRDGFDFADFVRDAVVTADKVLFSLDIDNMFGSVPVKETIDYVLSLWDDDAVKATKLSKDDLRALLNLVSCPVFLAPDGSMWRQDTGFPMGGPVSPILCSIYVDMLTKRAGLDTRLDWFRRYVDDTMCCGRASDIPVVLEALHAADTTGSVRWTCERADARDSIAFLDLRLTVRRCRGGKVELSPYWKSSSVSRRLHPSSNHDPHQAAAWITSMLWRYARYFTDGCRRDAVNMAIGRIRKLSRINGIPYTFVKGAIDRFLSRPDFPSGSGPVVPVEPPLLICQDGERLGTLYDSCPVTPPPLHDYKPDEGDVDVDGQDDELGSWSNVLVLPWDRVLVPTLRRVLRPISVRVACRSPRVSDSFNGRRHAARVGGPANYISECYTCRVEYHGETVDLGRRAYEHLKSKDSRCVRHADLTGHTMTDPYPLVLCVRELHRRRFLEAVVAEAARFDGASLLNDVATMDDRAGLLWAVNAGWRLPFIRHEVYKWVGRIRRVSRRLHMGMVLRDPVDRVVTGVSPAVDLRPPPCPVFSSPSPEPRIPVVRQEPPTPSVARDLLHDMDAPGDSVDHCRYDVDGAGSPDRVRGVGVADSPQCPNACAPSPPPHSYPFPRMPDAGSDSSVRLPGGGAVGRKCGVCEAPVHSGGMKCDTPGCEWVLCAGHRIRGRVLCGRHRDDVAPRKRCDRPPPTGRWWPSVCRMCGSHIPQNEDCLFCDVHGCEWAVCGGHGISADSPLMCPSHMGSIPRSVRGRRGGGGYVPPAVSVSRSVRVRRQFPRHAAPVPLGDAAGAPRRNALVPSGIATGEPPPTGRCGGEGGGSSRAPRAVDMEPCTADDPPVGRGCGAAGGDPPRGVRAGAVSPEIPDPQADVPSVRAYFFYPSVIRRARFIPEAARNVCMDGHHAHMVMSGAIARARIRVDRFLNCPNRRCLFCCRWMRVDNPTLPGVCPQHGVVPAWWVQRNPRPPLPPKHD